jgi:hypothetical protein
MSENSEEDDAQTAPSEELPALQTKGWVVMPTFGHRTKYTPSVQTFGFCRYNKPELRITGKLIPIAVPLLYDLGEMHFSKEIEEGEFTCDGINHHTGERWRFMAKKCTREQVLASSQYYIELYQRLGEPNTDAFYEFGIMEIVISDEDNLLPGEAGFDTDMEVPLATMYLQ